MAERVAANVKVDRMAGIISSSCKSGTIDDSDDAHSAVDSYTKGYNRSGDRKGKGSARKW